MLLDDASEKHDAEMEEYRQHPKHGFKDPFAGIAKTLIEALGCVLAGRRGAQASCGVLELLIKPEDALRVEIVGNRHHQTASEAHASWNVSELLASI
jgi:hypothetical protein